MINSIKGFRRRLSGEPHFHLLVESAEGERVEHDPERARALAARVWERYLDEHPERRAELAQP